MVTVARWKVFAVLGILIMLITWLAVNIAQTASASGPAYDAGTTVDLCIGSNDHVYAEAGADAGIPGSCAAGYTQLPVVSGGTVASATDAVTVDNPGAQENPADATVSLQLYASSSDATITSWTAVGLPGSLAINDSGLISGSTGDSTGTFIVTVTAKDSDNIAGSASFDWTVNT